MRHIKIKGADIPCIGFGTYKLEGDLVRAPLEAALSAGYRHIDTAQIYANEAEIGETLQKSGLPRSDLFLTTKVWPDRLQEGVLEDSVDESLERLQTDYVNLLLIHWPNPDVPIEETMRAMNRVRAAGKARHIGVSNFPTRPLRAAIAASEAPLVADQVEYHPFLDQSILREELRRRRMALVAYCPLARGQVIDEPLLHGIGDRYDKTATQVALRWLIQQRNTAAIPRSEEPAHIEANIDIFDFELTRGEMVQIANLSHPGGRLVDVEGAPDWD